MNKFPQKRKADGWKWQYKNSIVFYCLKITASSTRQEAVLKLFHLIWQNLRFCHLNFLQQCFFLIFVEAKRLAWSHSIQMAKTFCIKWQKKFPVANGYFLPFQVLPQ